MFSPPASYIELAHWTSVLDRLGVTSVADILPAKVRCPVCQQTRLAVYPDYTAGGQRMHCSQCVWAGDPIQLAARVWNISVRAAILRLRHLHIPLDSDPKRTAVYLRTIEYRKRALDFWHAARKRPIHHSNAASRLVHELGWQDGLSTSRRPEGPGRLFGWASRLSVEQLFMPTASRGPNHRCVVSSARVFVGRHWGDDVLVVPFWQLPYQLCGFVFIGRDANPDSDFIYRRLNIRCANGHAESGLAIHPQVPRKLAQNGRRLLLTTDLAAATSWQIRQLVNSPQPLPLAVWNHGEDHVRKPVSTLSAWHWFHDHNLVFWMPSPDPTTLTQAAKLGAMISTSGPTSNVSLTEYVKRDGTPSSICRRTLDAAKPWRSVFANLLEKAPEQEATDLLLRFQSDGLSLDDVLARCPARARRRADQLLPSSHSIRSLSHKNERVYEEDSCWYRVRTGPKNRPEPPRLICNAMLRVRQIVTLTGRPGEGYYRGEVLYKHIEFPFCVDKAALERGTWRWLREFLIEQKAGALQYDPTYGEPLQLAMRFHPPEIVEESPRIGWRTDVGELTLPKFLIRAAGEVVTREQPPEPTRLPGDCLPPPEPCSPIEIEGLVADRLGSPGMWAVVAATLTNILGRPFHEPSTAVALGGPGAAWTGRLVAEALGCPRFEVSCKRELLQASTASRRHDWPSHLEIGSALLRKTIQDWLRRDDHNCLTSVTGWNLLACQTEGRWLAVCTDHGWAGDDVLIDALRLFVSSYLQDVLRRRLNLQAPANVSLCRQLLHDMSWYATQITESGQKILEALPLVGGDSPTSRVASFAELLHRFVQQGRAIVRRRGFDECLAEQAGKARLYYDDAELFLNRQDLAKLLADVGAMAIREQLLTQTLSAANVLIDETPKGWRLKRSWWDEWRQAYVSSQFTSTGETAAKASGDSSNFASLERSGQTPAR